VLNKIYLEYIVLHLTIPTEAFLFNTDVQTNRIYSNTFFRSVVKTELSSIRNDVQYCSGPLACTYNPFFLHCFSPLPHVSYSRP
jgi:hypothetical protein